LAVPSRIVEAYRRQRYHFIGQLAVLKPCHWTRKSILTGGREVCYKQRFYGIQSHRCIQMSPTIACNLRCVFCWRVQPGDLGLEWSEVNVSAYDDPEDIVEKAIFEQRRVLSGFKGNPKANMKMVEEAFNPKHAAISLVGEPTLYPMLGELVEAFKRRGFTTFIVSNGTNPKALLNLSSEPTQLYVTLAAPTREVYLKAMRPLIPDAWERLNETLEVLHSFKCPKVLRLTLARNINMLNPEGYAKLIIKAEPTYVEPKAAMSIGYFTKRLTVDSMPRHDEVKAFAMELSNLTSYKLIDESPQSRVVLLSKLSKPIKLV